MQKKNLAILAVLAGCLLVITIVLYSRAPKPTTGFRPGTLLIQGMAPEKIASILIRKGDNTVTLVRRDEGFQVKEKGYYPAQLKKINDLVIKCMDIRCAAKVTEDAEAYAKLGVAEPGKAGEDGADPVSVTFLDAQGKSLIGFVKGDYMESGSGVYVRLTDGKTVYGTEDYLTIPTAPTDFIDSQLIQLDKKDIQRVSVRIGEDAYAIARKDKDTVELENIPEGRKAKGTDYESVFSALTSLSFNDVLPASEKKLEWDGTYRCALENKVTYTVQTVKDGEKYYARVSAVGPPVESVTITKDESDEELKKKEALLTAADTARSFAKKHSGWIYELSSWNAGKLRKPLGDLVEDIEKAEEPKEVAARHILISYKGAERSEATRTKEEARKRAEEVLAKAKAEGADFAALAKEYSDGPSGAKGGDLGTFGRGQMAKAFEEATWKLKVGEISGIVETPFGFHIIKRTK
jgi:hypothetical protein